MSLKNIYIHPPSYQENLNVEQVAGFTLMQSKIFKVTLIGIAPFPEPLSRKNIFKSTLVCQCDCGHYCKFNFKKFTHPDFLPACGQCNKDIEDFIGEYFYQHQVLLSPQQAWQKVGYVKDKKLTSTFYWYGMSRSNSYKIRLGAGFKTITDDVLSALGAPRYLYLSRASMLAPKQFDPQDTTLVYQCMCGSFAQFRISFLKQFEPIGMCSVCNEELRYFFNDYSLNAALSQLSFKHMWKDYLRAQALPYVEFRYVWEEYFRVRSKVRDEHMYELHLKDYIPQYFIKHNQLDISSN